MEQQLPVALQILLYTASVAIIVVAAVVVHTALHFRKQLDRAVAAAEHVESELIPLARQAGAVIGRAHAFSERTVGEALGLLLPPVVAVNRTIGLLQTGITTFLRALFA